MATGLTTWTDLEYLYLVSYAQVESRIPGPSGRGPRIDHQIICVR
jgi:hypothetical protein